MKVIAFNGSPRKNGNTTALIKHLFAVLESEGIKTELVQLADERLHGCTSCMGCFKSKDNKCAMLDDNANALIAKMIEADGIILASPTHFADVTPNIKALIDRAGFVAIANGGLFRRKAGAAVVAVRRGGAIHAFDTMNHFFGIEEMVTVGSNYWNMGVGLKPGDIEQDKEGVETMQTLGRNMAWLLKKLA